MFQGSQERRRRRALRGAAEDRRPATSTAPPTSTAPTTSRSCPANQLETALWLESDRMGYLLDDAHREEPRQPARGGAQRAAPELRQRARTARSSFAIAASALSRGPPVPLPRRSAATRTSTPRHVDDVKDFFRTWYVPGQRHARDRRRLRRRRRPRSWSRSGSAPSPRRPSRSRRRSRRRRSRGRSAASVDDSLAKLRRVHYAWHTPALFAPGDAELDVAGERPAASRAPAGSTRSSCSRSAGRATSAVYQESRQLSGVFHVSPTCRTTPTSPRSRRSSTRSSTG